MLRSKKITTIVFICLLFIFIFFEISQYFYKNSIKEIKTDINKVEEVKNQNNNKTLLSMEGVKIYAEVVQTKELVTLGLSGRKSLEKDSGMLFVFEKLDFYGFWMKEMNFPLDIIWLNGDLDVVHIEKSLSPDTFPTVFGPKVASKYVLEVNSGFADKNKIKVGSKLKILE